MRHNVNIQYIFHASVIIAENRPDQAKHIHEMPDIPFIMPNQYIIIIYTYALYAWNS